MVESNELIAQKKHLISGQSSAAMVGRSDVENDIEMAKTIELITPKVHLISGHSSVAMVGTSHTKNTEETVELITPKIHSSSHIPVATVKKNKQLKPNIQKVKDAKIPVWWRLNNYYDIKRNLPNELSAIATKHYLDYMKKNSDKKEQ